MTTTLIEAAPGWTHTALVPAQPGGHEVVQTAITLPWIDNEVPDATPAEGLEDLIVRHKAPLREVDTLFVALHTGVGTVGSYAASAIAAPLTATIEAALRLHARARAEVRPRPSRAYRAVREIASTLDYSIRDTAQLLGISRGTIYAWREGREPQPRNARRLYRLHTLLRTLNRRLGMPATREWLNSGVPAPIDLLAAEDFGAVDRLASAMIFGSGAMASERVGAAIAEPLTGDDPAEAGDAPALRRIRRRPPAKRSS